MRRCVVVASALDFAEESLGLALGFAWLPRFLNVFEGFGDESHSTELLVLIPVPGGWVEARLTQGEHGRAVVQRGDGRNGNSEPGK
jgi:hypothetical protein